MSTLIEQVIERHKKQTIRRQIENICAVVFNNNYTTDFMYFEGYKFYKVDEYFTMLNTATLEMWQCASCKRFVKLMKMIILDDMFEYSYGYC